MLVIVDNLTKRYSLSDDSKSLVLIFKRQRDSLFKKQKIALDNITFKINKGEAFGIIGRNGSGKSTLLQIIAGTVIPSSGNVKINGKVSALLELGSGFNPEFTGIENIYLYGSILGIPRSEMAKKITDIEEFADIGSFINMPVRTYSSGMLMRVAFAVAIAVEPDLLIIDEALSVGDILFQQKCAIRLKELVSKGVALLVVTHDTSFVLNMCQRALWLHEGKAQFLGTASECVQRYLSAMAALTGNTDISGSFEVTASARRPPTNGIDLTNIKKLGDSLVTINQLWITNKSKDISTFYVGNWCKVLIEVASSITAYNVSAGIELKDRLGQVVFATGLRVIKKLIDCLEPNETKLVEVSFQLNIAPGQYTLDVGCGSGLGEGNTGFRLLNVAIIEVSLDPADDIVHGIAKLPYEINVYKN